jgi:L,D-transpeptidase ErfK/SrfK
MLMTKLIALFLALLPLGAVAEVYDLPPEGNDVVGALTTVTAREEDTLLDIARRHGLGYEDIVRANPDVDTWLPGEGTEVTLPTRYVLPPGPRNGVVLNLAEYRLYYYPTPEEGKPAVVMTYPISIGRMDWETPLGRTTIISKVKNPSWYPPESIRAEHAADGDPLPRIVPAGPQNPLGDYAMRLGLPGYLIHGTNRPDGVGMRVTHGCIRMFPEDIDYLFGRVNVSTAVRIINEPVKIGWNADELVIEVHETLEVTLPETVVSEDVSGEEAPAEVEPPIVRDAMTALTEQFVAATNERSGQLDWDTAEELLARADGIPAVAGRRIKDAATSAASE